MHQLTNPKAMPADLQQHRVDKHRVPKEWLLQPSSAHLPPPCSQPAESPCPDLLPLHVESYKQQPKGFFDLRLCMWQAQQRQGAVLARCIHALTSGGIKRMCLRLRQRTKKKHPSSHFCRAVWEGQAGYCAGRCEAIHSSSEQSVTNSGSRPQNRTA